MSSRHGELEEFSCRGKQLLLELKKIPECDSQHIREDMDAILDQWLDVSLQSDRLMLRPPAEVTVQMIREQFGIL